MIVCSLCSPARSVLGTADILNVKLDSNLGKYQKYFVFVGPCTALQTARQQFVNQVQTYFSKDPSVDGKITLEWFLRK